VNVTLCRFLWTRCSSRDADTGGQAPAPPGPLEMGRFFALSLQFGQGEQCH
jgi:hypothetical protein